MNPQTPPQKPGAVGLVCNSNVGKAEAGELLVLVGHPAPAELVSSKFSEGPCCENKVDRKTLDLCLAHTPHTHGCAGTHTVIIRLYPSTVMLWSSLKYFILMDVCLKGL